MNKIVSVIFVIIIIIMILEMIALKCINDKYDKYINELTNNKQLQAVMKCNDNETIDFFTKCVAWELEKK